MPKSKRRAANRRQLAVGAPDPRQQGLRAFHAGRFGEAIAIWAPMAPNDPQVRAALAEAYFRRAVSPTVRERTIDDLRRAVELSSDEPRYQYHLGMALHRARDLPAAIEIYRALLRRDPAWPGAGLLLALATLEQNPRANLAALPGGTPTIQATLAPVQALLRGQAPASDGGEAGTIERLLLGLDQSSSGPLARLWRGLGLIAAGDGSARQELDDVLPLPNASLTAVRRYYKGVAAAQAGDRETALKLWQQVYEGRIFTAGLLDNLAAALLQQLTAQLDAGDLEGAAATAQQTIAMPLGSAAFNQARVQALDRAAHAAAGLGDWERATALWESARQIVGASAGLGSPRPLLHNLALAYEAQERWMEAADAWRAMLRTRPRKAAADKPGDDDSVAGLTLSDDQWAWVRKRVIECYKQAGRPDEAVTVFRQMIKAEPNDPDLRLQLADALLANQQEQAAYNEVQRILQIDPQHVDALIRSAVMLSARGEWPRGEQIMRDLIARHPERVDLRRQLARLLLNHGTEYMEYRQYPAAARAFAEGQQLDPENYQFPINLAKALFNQRKPAQARPLLERTLELAGDQPDPYVQVIECWVIEDQIKEARAVLARAEATLTPTPDFYVSLGTMIILQTAPPPPAITPFMLAPPPKPPKPTDNAWSRLAVELLDRAVVLQPNDSRLHGRIAGDLMMARPDLAERYAEEAVRLDPEEPNLLILLGLVLALNDRVREAKEKLRRAEQLARKQGKPDLAQQAAAMRHEVDSPFLRMSLQMSAMVGFDDLDDEYYF